MNEQLKRDVKVLMRHWDQSNQAAEYRNKLRKLAAYHDYDDVADFVEAVYSNKISSGVELPPPTTNTPLRDFAARILAEGYQGEYMKDQEDAMRWIKSMAEGYQDEHDLNEAGKMFWKAVKSKYGLWLVDHNQEKSA